MRKHWRYLNYVVRHKWFVFVAGLRTGAPLWRLLIHDWSKFLPSEWGPYVATFYGGWKYADRPAHVVAAFDAAWLHHQHANPHHWQHWVLREDSGAVKLLPMPQHFMREMVADWMGAGRAITGKWEAGEWYAKNRDKIQIEQQTRIRVEGLLSRHAGLKCVWGCNGGSPTYCREILNGCEAHSSAFGPADLKPAASDAP